MLRLVSDIFASTILRFAARVSLGVQASEVMVRSCDSRVDMASAVPGQVPDTTPRQLIWKLDNSLHRAVCFAEVRLADLVDQNATATLVFDAFGKLGIVKHKFSPDGFVQLALQATYYSLYGTIVCALVWMIEIGFMLGNSARD